MGHNIKQLRMVYNAAKRDGMAQLYELMGDEDQTVVESQEAAPEVGGDSSMMAPTPSTSVGSESDMSEASESKGKCILTCTDVMWTLSYLNFNP